MDGMFEMYYDREGKPMTMKAWAKKFGDMEYKRVARDELEGGEVVVSTVWLGANHQWGKGPPLIFETMVFGGPHDEWMDRYTTEEEARAGHDRVVDALTEGRDLEEII